MADGYSSPSRNTCQNTHLSVLSYLEISFPKRIPKVKTFQVQKDEIIFPQRLKASYFFIVILQIKFSMQFKVI